MKELSIEEKIKAYDGLIERLKDLKFAYRFTSLSDTIEEIFPELKEENEDERIRKSLIELVKQSCDVLYPPNQKAMLVWLEKQGKNNMGISEATKKKLEDNLNKALEKETPESWNEFLEKQGEQKPAWSEEDEKIVEGLVSKILANYNGCSTINGISEDRVINWLKSLKDRVQPQPKQEWSQNDIDMIDWLIRCCEKEHEELCNDKYGHQDIVSDLKRDCRKKWDWLESLKNRVAPQKQWKPSDKQLKALNTMNVTGCITEVGQGKSLIELYNDLKKLSEE